MSKSTGRVIWCVDFTGHAFQRGDTHTVQTNLVRVLQTFQQYQTPATWMLPDPAGMKSICGLITPRPGQEIGLLGESWTAEGRSRLSQELADRVESARRLGIAVDTLATKEMEPHLDLLVRHQIAGVRLDQEDANLSSRRFGIWQTTTTESVPGMPGLFSGRLAYRKLVVNAARQQKTILLRVDADEVAVSEASMKLFQGVCQTVAGQGLRPARFAEHARVMTSTVIRKPARSILRAA